MSDLVSNQNLRVLVITSIAITLGVTAFQHSGAIVETVQQMQGE